MDKNKEMEKLFQKFIENSMTQEEFELLFKFIKNPDSQEDVKVLMNKYWEGIDASQKLIEKRNDREPEMIFQQIMNKIENKNPVIRMQKRSSLMTIIRKSNIFKVAAAIVVIVGLAYFYENGFFLAKHTSSLNNMFETNAITLILDNGDTKIISENGNEKIINKEGVVVGSQEGTKLDYKNIIGAGKVKEKEEKLAYNKLTVPYGKNLQLILSDGTLVYLNAGTTLKYPVKFLEGEKRQVYLQGEAYFEVTKDKAHPFIVSAGDVNVRVLGTKFNVNSYSNNDAINTILVEGSVELFGEKENLNKNNSILLSPNQIAAWDKLTKSVNVSKIETKEYVSWIKGTLEFKTRTFSEILKILERHYNISIINNYEYLNNQQFFAKFDTENIEEVLTSFSNSEPFYFERKGNVIIISKPKN